MAARRSPLQAALDKGDWLKAKELELEQIVAAFETEPNANYKAQLSRRIADLTEEVKVLREAADAEKKSGRPGLAPFDRSRFTKEGVTPVNIDEFRKPS